MAIAEGAVVPFRVTVAGELRTGTVEIVRLDWDGIAWGYSRCVVVESPHYPAGTVLSLQRCHLNR